MTVSIVSPSAAAVKPRRHPRFRREPGDLLTGCDEYLS